MRSNQKINSLVREIKKYIKIGVAFSGGKDSFFLLKMAVDVLGRDNVIAFYAIGNFSSRLDNRRIEYFQSIMDFHLRTVRVELSAEKKIWSNPRNRCYLCKDLIFGHIKRDALRVGIDTIFDGSTHSDLSEYRPGLKATKELGVISPMQNARITSTEIEKYLKNMGIKEYFLTSSTCLATRFPYQHKLVQDEIKQFDEIEMFLTDLGIFPVRIRYIPDGIRIETVKNQFKTIISHRQEIIDFCKTRSQKFITLDLGEFKSGTWD
jgi:uncharacterized protein